MLSEQDSERILPLFAENLDHPDAEVRKWTLLALTTRGDAALPLLKEALADESDDTVKHQLEASITQLEKAAEDRAWLENQPCADLTLDDVKDWDVRELCDPFGKYPPVIVDLSDGTFICGSRHQANDGCFRGKRKKKCSKR